MKLKFILGLTLLTACITTGCQNTTSEEQFEDTDLSFSSVSSAPEEDTAEAAAVPSSSDYEKYDNSSLNWGQGVQFDDQNRPISCIEYQEKYGELAADFIRTDETAQNIYLTFDEGYENGYTDDILDTLKEKNCPAVFFVTLGYVKENPGLIQRMIDEGHIVGHHSADHPKDGMPSLSIEDQVKDIQKLEDYMSVHFNYEMDLFRFPAGTFSERSLALMKDLGYTNVFWSFAYADWDPNQQTDPAATLEKLNTRLHSGAIYLLHAVSSTNANILGIFIDSARESGYVFCAYE